MIGLYGGAFDPPHLGHVALARAAHDAFRLEELVVLVVVDPGHKATYASADVRIELAEVAFSGLPRTRVEPEPHARTVDALEAREQVESVFLVGADEWRDFFEWKAPERVLELTKLAVATRPGYDVHVPEEWRHRVLTFEIDPVPVSSTEVRRRVAAGEAIDDLVGPDVAASIEQLGLYRGE